MKNLINKILEKVKSIKKPVLASIAVILVLLVVLTYRNIRSQSREVSVTGDVNTIRLAKTDIQNTLSVSGQVDSSDTINIYSTLTSYPVEEIFVEVGDKVIEGDIIAQIDTTNLDYEIKQAENNLENAIKSLNTEKQNNQNSITNAENSLNSAIISRDKQQLSYDKILADYEEAEETMLKSFDSYSYDIAINEAKVQLDRELEDLENAEDDHYEAQDDFDDYTYQNAIDDAQAKLERADDDLRDARNDLRDQERDFDDYEDIRRSAKTDLDRAEEILKELENNPAATEKANLDEKHKAYETALENNGHDSTHPDVVSAENARNQAQSAYDSAMGNINSQIEAAKVAVENAQKEYDLVVEALEQIDNRVKTAERDLDSARNAADDAERAYDRTITDLERAQDSSIEAAENTIETAEKAVDDAQRSYDKAISDLERAQDDYIEDNEEKLTVAKQNLADAEKSLEASNLSVINAENSLKQTKSKVAPSTSTVSNQQITLDKLLEQKEKSQIKATGTGTITSVDAVEGTNPTGVLFVIEDTNMLYVTAKVKEYDLRDLSLGQRSLVTTDATDTEVFDGEIVFISPKAVTEAGSTNVEFEIWVKIHAPNENIKIGMNAFVEIVLEEKQDTFVVPLSSIITNEDGDFIQIKSDDEEVSLMPVEIGIKTSTSAEIFGDGLVDGMMIISSSYSFSQDDIAPQDGMLLQGGGGMSPAGGRRPNLGN